MLIFHKLIFDKLKKEKEVNNSGNQNGKECLPLGDRWCGKLILVEINAV